MDNQVYQDYLITLGQQLEYLKVKGLPGLSSIKGNQANGKVVAENWSPFRFPDIEKQVSNNEFLIKCPYAGITITVQILFNVHEPWASPDFTVLDSEFMENITIEDLNDDIPCLNSWNYMSKDIIQTFLTQLVQLYKKYQLKSLEMEELLYYEYSSLLSTLKVAEDDIELSISGSGTYLASILIRLPINLDDIPPVLLCGNPGPPSTMLLINVKKTTGVIVPKIYIPPQVENLIGGTAKLVLPMVPPGSSLTDYADNLLTTVRDRIKQTLKKFEARKQAVAELLCHFGSSLIEYDAERFTQASFLFCIKEFYVIATINLGEKRETSSRLVLGSVYHHGAKYPLFDVKDVCIEGKSPQNIVDNMKINLLKYIPIFRKRINDSHKN